LSEHEVFTNLLVLDEVIYVSKRRYDVKQEDTLEFIDRLTPSPALKGEGSLQGFHRFSPSIRAYVFHLGSTRSGRRSPISSRALLAFLTHSTSEDYQEIKPQ